MKVFLCSVGTSIQRQSEMVEELTENAPKLTKLIEKAGPGQGGISAEIHTLRKSGYQPGDRVCFIHFGDRNGRDCARLNSAVLRQELKQEQAGLIETEQAGLKITGEGNLNLRAELPGFVRAFYTKIGKHRHDDIHLLATGGFKPMGTIVTIIGLMHGFPVHYIHESNDDLFTYFGLPIKLDEVRLKQSGEFFLWLKSLERTPAEVEKEIQDSAIEWVRPMVDYDFSGNTCRTGFMGELFLLAWLHREARVNWGENSERLPDEKNFLVPEDMADERKKNLLGYLTRLGFVDELRPFFREDSSGETTRGSGAGNQSGGGTASFRLNFKDGNDCWQLRLVPMSEAQLEYARLFLRGVTADMVDTVEVIA